MDEASLFSMGSDAADYNNDGFTDLLTLDMLAEDNKTQKMHSGAENFDKFQQLFVQGFYYQYSRNMLQKNNGDGTFSEVGQLQAFPILTGVGLLFLVIMTMMVIKTFLLPMVM